MQEVNYSTLKLGERFYSNFHITYDLMKDFIHVVDESMQIPIEGKVPNYIFALYKPVHEAFGSVAQGTIHVKQKMEHYSDAYIGNMLDVVVTVKNKYKKQQKEFLIIEIDYIYGDRLICRQETTHIWALTKGGKNT